MSSDSTPLVIHARQIGKRYLLGASPHRRLWQLLFGGGDSIDSFKALQGVDLDVSRGESIGIIGQNGAGKSTLLQLLCGTLTPSDGFLNVSGRVAALLELGAGFNQEFTGRENIRFSAALQGMGPQQINSHMQEIIDFADIGAFIDQPVRTYSTGMYVRLAFAIATSVKPDILVIDEALSVGDGAFARKSFDRIMQLKQDGVTLLFCSHSLFQVEALCTRCIWLHQGQIMAQGASADVIAAYNDWLAQKSTEQGVSRLDASSLETSPPEISAQDTSGHGASAASASSAPSGSARLTDIRARCDDISGNQLQARSGESELAIDFAFASDPSIPTPNLAVVIHGADGRALCSSGNWIDGIPLVRSADGLGRARISFPRLPLLKGRYTLSGYLMCERAVHVYDAVEHFASIEVSQPHLEQGMFSIPHQWRTN